VNFESFCFCVLLRYVGKDEAKMDIEIYTLLLLMMELILLDMNAP